jgi:hypothetical protein
MYGNNDYGNDDDKEFSNVVEEMDRNNSHDNIITNPEVAKIYPSTHLADASINDSYNNNEHIINSPSFNNKHADDNNYDGAVDSKEKNYIVRKETDGNNSHNTVITNLEVDETAPSLGQSVIRVVSI